MSVSGRVWAITMAKNEADIIRAAVMHMLSEQVDGIIVADNLSTDGTGEIVRDLAATYEWLVPIIVVDDRVPGYYQAKKMTALAHQAAKHGAQWIIPFDADELWCGLEEPLAMAVERASSPVLAIESWTHVVTAKDDEGEANPAVRLRWRRQNASSLPKMAYRYHRDLSIHQGNDGIVSRDGKLLPSVPLLEAQIRHFPARSEDQFVRKMGQGAAAYRAAPDLPESFGSHWRHAGEILEKYGQEGLRAMFYATWVSRDPVDEHYVEDPAPWCRWGK